MLKNLSSKSFIFIISSIFTLGLLNVVVFADELDINYKFNINVSENTNAAVELKVIFNINEINKIVNNYEISIPIKNGTNFSVDIDGEIQNSVNRSNQNGYEKLSINFNRPITYGGSRVLTISFNASDLVKQNFDIKQLYIPNPFDNKDVAIDYEITYPKSFGKASNGIADSDTHDVGDNYVVNLQSNSGIYVIWSERININISSFFSISNDEVDSNSFLLNLPSESKFGNIIYDEIRGADSGMYDKYGNYFALISLQTGIKKDIGYSTNITLSNDYQELDYPDKYSFNLDTSSDFIQEALNSTQNLPDYEKIKIFSQLLIKKVAPYKEARIDLNALEGIWKKLQGSSNINSFEYSSLLVGFAEHLGLKAKINYGYIMMTPAEIDIALPQTWVEIEVDGRSIIIDNFMEDLSGVSYFDWKASDRIKFGTWHPSQSYNSALGLASNSDLVAVEYSQYVYQGEIKTPEVLINLGLPNSITPGIGYDSVINIANKSKQNLKIERIIYDGVDITGRIKFNNQLDQFILPLQNNKITLNNFVHFNLLSSGQLDLSANAKFNNVENEFSSTAQVNYQPGLVTVLIGILTIVLVVVGIILGRKYYLKNLK